MQTKQTPDEVYLHDSLHYDPIGVHSIPLRMFLQRKGMHALEKSRVGHLHSPNNRVFLIA